MQCLRPKITHKNTETLRFFKEATTTVKKTANFITQQEYSTAMVGLRGL